MPIGVIVVSSEHDCTIDGPYRGGEVFPLHIKAGFGWIGKTGDDSCGELSTPAFTALTLSFNFKGLLEVPTGVDPAVTSLSMSFNEIKQLPDYSFSNLTLLNKLTLSYNKIWNIGSLAFEGCPITELKLHNNLLTSFPNLTSIGPTLSILTLGYNRLVNVNGELLEPLIVLKEISMEGETNTLSSDLTFVPSLQATVEELNLAKVNLEDLDDAFRDTIPTLKILELNTGSWVGNNVSNYNFLGATLETLYMVNMQLEEFPVISTLGPTLKYLCLSQNHFLEPITSDKLDVYSVLSRLEVSDCGITTFPDLTSVADTLGFIDLESNNISYLPEDAFTEHHRLYMAKLSDNPFLKMLPNFTTGMMSIYAKNIGLEDLPCSYLQQHPGLLFFTVSGNPFRSFPLECLPGKLYQVELDRTAIEYLPSKNLSHLTKLTKIVLKDSQLKCMDEFTISDTPLKIDLTGINMHCDCCWNWTKKPQFLINAPTLILDDEPCKSPSHLVGIPWSEITIQQLVCGEETTVETTHLDTTIMPDGASLPDTTIMQDETSLSDTTVMPGDTSRPDTTIFPGESSRSDTTKFTYTAAQGKATKATKASPHVPTTPANPSEKLSEATPLSMTDTPEGLLSAKKSHTAFEASAVTSHDIYPELMPTTERAEERFSGLVAAAHVL
ncbi:hypothetical protein CAPTEDRAFT_215673 [Capitella teleta]|uniref:LRRCT domain-containing protein n=1 Tax=Capitella teleta TaxID=283909 RepID=R7U1F9_CAPTE|nr:hypothetical protein CAPTEDRAFT_215673 [Capitella teleta]|eukprot:ELT97030.1 hypothetical protein CAPTEDRAFT_215673 [Capitella teleta]